MLDDRIMTEDGTATAKRLSQQLQKLLALPVLQSGTDMHLHRVKQANAIQAEAEQLLAYTVEDARDSGMTWQQIGEALGISRQAAFRKFGRPVDPRTGEPMATTPHPGATGLASTVVDDLAHWRWQQVTARFDDRMRQGLDGEALAAAWAQIVGAAGQFESAGEPEAARAAEFTITNTPIHFEAGEFVARITFRDDETIAGLFLVPPGTP